MISAERMQPWAHTTFQMARVDWDIILNPGFLEVTPSQSNLLLGQCWSEVLVSTLCQQASTCSDGAGCGMRSVVKSAPCVALDAPKGMPSLAP